MECNIFLCVLCKERDSENNLVTLTKKGFESLQSASEARKDNICSLLYFTGDVAVHENCRKNYVSKRKVEQYIKKQQTENTKINLDTRDNSHGNAT